MSRQRSADAARFKPKYFYQFRIILIGDSTVGKSSLLRQFTEGQFIENSDPTVGVDFHVRVVMLSCKLVTSSQYFYCCFITHACSYCGLNFFIAQITFDMIAWNNFISFPWLKIKLSNWVKLLLYGCLSAEVVNRVWEFFSQATDNLFGALHFWNHKLSLQFYVMFCEYHVVRSTIKDWLMSYSFSHLGVLKKKNAVRVFWP